MSEEYNGNNKNLQWKCLKEDCGEIFESAWGNIQIGYGCGYCDGKQVGLSNCLATKNPKLASEWHSTKNGDLTPWDVTCGSNKRVWWRCEKGHEWSTNIVNRSTGKRCPYCAKTIKYTIEEVIDFAKSINYICLSDIYKSNSKKLHFICDKGHDIQMCFASLLNGCRCNTCCNLNFKGENNPSWKNGISYIQNYFRKQITFWKDNSMRNCNYRCIISGQYFNIIHHLYPFNKILEETFSKTNISMGRYLKDYTNKELDILSEIFLKLHNKYGLGVCLTTELHKKFHNKYGVKNFTPENFYEFYKDKTGRIFDPSFLMINNKNII